MERDRVVRRLTQVYSQLWLKNKLLTLSLLVMIIVTLDIV